MEVNGSGFIVTGASSGLGVAVACMLAGAGANVVGLDLNPPAGGRLAAQFNENALFHRADVTSETDIAAALQFAKKRFGPIHGLVNCAGIAPGEKTLGRKGPHSLESFARTITINLIGTFNMVRLVAEAMALNEPDKEGARGVIVNTASVAAFDGQIGQAGYAASKGGVTAMTLPLARELAQFGIRVMTIAPGIFETPMMSGMSQDIQDSLTAHVPFPSRFGRPEEYAALVKHIFENSMLNGEVIRLDGALRMPP